MPRLEGDLEIMTEMTTELAEKQGGKIVKGPVLEPLVPVVDRNSGRRKYTPVSGLVHLRDTGVVAFTCSFLSIVGDSCWE